MALIEYRRCSHCGKTTWQEFVPQADPTASYWRCRDCGDRRAAKRVCLARNALLHRGRIETGRTCAAVCIIDISPDGARLSLDEDMPVEIRTNQALRFNPQLQPTGELSQYLPAIVRWTRGLEFGLAFARPLSLPSGDIRCIVKN
ncbi:MAG: PilZ domain-containing protein [Acidobacteriota bacterium]